MPRRFIRAILFDLGGTLMYARNPWPPIVQQADEALADYLGEKGIVLNRDTFPYEFRTRLEEYYNRREHDLFETTYLFILQELLTEKGYGDVPDNVLRAALDRLFSVTQQNWILEDDAISTLKKLDTSGYRMGLISNAGDNKDVLQLVDRFGLRSYFEFIVTSAACSYRKPHPRIFELALSNWYFLPEEAAMVGDTLDADIRGAKKAGLYSIWISRRAMPDEEELQRIQPDATVVALSELPALLDKIQVG